MGLVHEEVALFVVGVVVEVYWWTLCDESPPFLDPLCFSNGTQVGLQKNSKNFSSSSLNEFFVDKMGILFDIAGNKIFLKGNGKYKNKKKKIDFFFFLLFFHCSFSQQGTAICNNSDEQKYNFNKRVF